MHVQSSLMQWAVGRCWNVGMLEYRMEQAEAKPQGGRCRATFACCKHCLGGAVTCFAAGVSKTYNIRTSKFTVIATLSLLLLRYNVVHSGRLIEAPEDSRFGGTCYHVFFVYFVHSLESQNLGSTHRGCHSRRHCRDRELSSSGSCVKGVHLPPSFW
jgi:hypothetical protein